MNEELKKDIEVLNLTIDKLQLTIEALDAKVTKHIGFIDNTYEGLKNPLRTATKFFGRK